MSVQQTAVHKNTAISFLRLAASGRAREAFQHHVGTGFRHHNPFFVGDADALMKAMDENAKENPQKTLDIKHVLEDGDLVAVHSHIRQQPSDRGAAVVHIFRFEQDRIVELWDVGQPVPESSPNKRGVF